MKILAKILLARSCSSSTTYNIKTLLAKAIYSTIILILFFVNYIAVSPVVYGEGDSINEKLYGIRDVGISQEKLSEDLYSISQEDMFTVRDVTIAVEDIVTEEAKSFAFIEAENKAARILLKKLIVADQHSKLDNINSDLIIPMIKNREIVWERITHNSYRALINVYFNSQAVQSFLNSRGIRYGMRYTPKTVIFPIIHSYKKYKVWDNSVWQSSLKDFEGKVGLLDTSIRRIRIDDLVNVDYNNAMSVPYATLMPLLRNHNAEDAIIVYIDDIINGEKHISEINLRFLAPKTDQYKFISYKKRAGESNYDYTNRVASDLLEKIDMLWKGIDKFDKNKIFSSELMVKSSEWPGINRQLKKINAISKVKFKENLKYKNFDNVILHYSVTPALLSSLLKNNNIDVVNKGDKTYISISRRASR